VREKYCWLVADKPNEQAELVSYTYNPPQKEKNRVCIYRLHTPRSTCVRTGLPAGLYYKPIDVRQSSPQSKPKVTELTT
jgi:hypothetical protein